MFLAFVGAVGDEAAAEAVEGHLVHAHGAVPHDDGALHVVERHVVVEHLVDGGHQRKVNVLGHFHHRHRLLGGLGRVGVVHHPLVHVKLAGVEGHVAADRLVLAEQVSHVVGQRTRYRNVAFAQRAGKRGNVDLAGRKVHVRLGDLHALRQVGAGVGEVFHAHGAAGGEGLVPFGFHVRHFALGVDVHHQVAGHGHVFQRVILVSLVRLRPPFTEASQV
jgi:hypothetical protein